MSFRRLLERHKLTERLFAEINAHLSERGLFVGKGTIVDATIINAPSSTKNAEKKRDPGDAPDEEGQAVVFRDEDAHRRRRGFGLVHTIQATGANVADVNVFGELLHGDEERSTAIRPITPRR